MTALFESNKSSPTEKDCCLQIQASDVFTHPNVTTFWGGADIPKKRTTPKLGFFEKNLNFGKQIVYFGVIDPA